jgi:CRP-like cAMP-binding protein
MADDLVGFVERALLLKALPVLCDASANQIAAVVEHLRERSFTPGTELFRVGAIVDGLRLLCKGRVRLELPGDIIARRCGPGDVVGWTVALEQRPSPYSCVAETAGRIAMVSVHDLFELGDDFFDLARSLLAHLARRVRGCMGRARPAPCFEVEGAPFVGVGRSLDLAEKIVFMRSVGLLHEASVDDLARLGKEVAEVAYATGDEVHRAGEPAAAFYLVLHGRLGARGPRTCVGALDVLLQETYSSTVVATEPSRVLRVPAERFFDLLEDHMDMTWHVVSDLGHVLNAAESEQSHGARARQETP